MLRLYLVGRGVHTLGPGSRYVVWVQGCKQRCPGCAAPESRPLDGGYLISVSDLAQRILAAPETEGITISGGEPFLQAEALARLIRQVRLTRDLGVIVYTGYTHEQLLTGSLPGAADLLSLIDLLVDGPYVDALNDDAALRGSSNQRAIPLTDRYLSSLADYGAAAPRQTEPVVSPDALHLAGIPPKDLMKRLRGE